jgi:hypothetical protein
MELNQLVLQLAIIFLPGLIWARMDTCYVLNSKPSNAEFLIRAFLFGITAYAITFLLFRWFGWEFAIVDITSKNGKLLTPKILNSVLHTLLSSSILSILWIYSSTYKWLTRFLRYIGATKKYGDEDVWDYTFNASSAAVEYVHFRDFERKLIYAGWVSTFSETGKLRELVLKNAQVLNFEGEVLYNMPLIYIARQPDQIHIDFPTNI